jgi:long-chain fatty acid transport protein
MQTQCISIQGHACQVGADGADVTLDQSVVQNIRRHWNDTYGVKAGASGWIVPKVEIFGGVGLETAAVPDATLEPGLGDAVNVTAAIGARFEVADLFFVAGSYTHIQYMNRDNTGKSELASAELPTRRPDGGGKYTQWIGLVNVNVEKQF